MYIISGLYKGRKIITPKGDLTRPTSSQLREALFNICQTYITGSSFLDLFAGSGAMGLEAISRGAEKAIFIDNSREAVRCIQENIRHLDLENCAQVLYGDVFLQVEKLSKLKHQFDIIYADPPYDTHSTTSEGLIYSSMIIKIIDDSNLLAPGGSLFIEESSKSRPEMTNFVNLKLKNSRKMGRSILQQYQKME